MTTNSPAPIHPATPSTQRQLEFSRFLTSAVCACAMVCVLLAGHPALAAAPAPSHERTVRGKVVDAHNHPVSSAIVYLKDMRTLAMQSYITQQDGAYRFEQLSPNDDYKLWAKLGKKKSGDKTISSFESRDHFVFILEIKTGK